MRAMFPSLAFDQPWLWYLLWNALGFSVAFVVDIFVEWAAHRWILHSPKIVKFAYNLHDQSHHVIFGADDTYSASSPEMRSHVVFVPRDYVMFLLVTTPLWVGAEWLIHRPVILGGVLATLTGLNLFNVLHWYYHCPKDSAFQRTRFFRFLREHHRLHHKDKTKNFNVFFFPLADWLLGTQVTKDTRP